MSRRGGLRRLGSRGRFRYVDAGGKRVGDEDVVARIQALAIPPAWRDVWISPSQSARLQATGVDAAGRRQYLYHEAFRAARDRAKFERLVRFGELLPRFRRRASGHVELGPYAEEWACAIAATLIHRGWFRVGSDRYARTSRTYGITTLTKRHVQVRGERIAFRFRGKGRAMIRTTLVDPELAEAVRALIDFDGGARLFRFERDGTPAPLTGALLNEYIAANLDPAFTAKDFRTWGGTLAAAVALAEHGPLRPGEDERRVLATVMRRVGTELGNTPAVARDSYVSPVVVERWREGQTLEDFRLRRHRVVAARGADLVPEEAALLRLLRSG